MAGDDSGMAGGESRMTGDCCWADGIQPDLYIDTYARILTCMPYIYGLVALLGGVGQASLASLFQQVTYRHIRVTSDDIE
jgi:hypothetical protein